MSELSFTNIRASGENGIFVAGGPMGVHPPGHRRPVLPPSISGLTIKGVQVGWGADGVQRCGG